MIHVESPPVFVAYILDVGPIVDVALEVFYVVFDVLRLVGDGKVKHVASKSEAQRVKAVTKSDLTLQVGV